MNWVSFGFETAATVVESCVALSAVTKMSGQKYTGKRHYLSIGGGVFVTIILVSICNFIETFSFVTAFLALSAVTILTRFTSTGSVLLRTTGSVLSFLAITTIDYSLLFAMGVLSKNTIVNYNTFIQLMSPGFLRYCYLIINKFIDVVLLFALGRAMSRLGSLRQSYLTALLTISSTAYIIMHFLLGTIFADSVYSMQIAIILSWIFMVLCVALVFGVFLISTNYQNEKEANKLLSLSNTLLKENYERLHESQDKMEKLNHDFKHHIRVIRNLAESRKTEKIILYTNSLLDSFQKALSLCYSGNAVIDSIINEKSAEAHAKRICFNYKINAPILESMEPVDICAILANQIDNAFEACQRIAEETERIVSVHIWCQTESIVFFQVSNRVLNNPFESNPELKSAKQDHLRPHGLGIKSIKKTAAKYEGLLENIYKDGYFISTVFLNFNNLRS